MGCRVPMLDGKKVFLGREIKRCIFLHSGNTSMFPTGQVEDPTAAPGYLRTPGGGVFFAKGELIARRAHQGERKTSSSKGDSAKKSSEAYEGELA